MLMHHELMDRFAPPGLSLARYDAAKRWSAARWQNELGCRRLLFGLFDHYPANGPRVLRYLDVLVDHLNAPGDHSPGAQAVGLYAKGEPPVEELSLARESLPVEIDGRRYRQEVLIGRNVPNPSLYFEATGIAFLAVNLQHPRPAIEETFNAWLTERTGVPRAKGRPAKSLNLTALRRWAKNRYPAYWDLLLWLTVLERPKPNNVQWQTLLAPDTLEHDSDRNRIPKEPQELLEGIYDAALQAAVDKELSA